MIVCKIIKRKPNGFFFYFLLFSSFFFYFSSFFIFVNIWGNRFLVKREMS